MTDRPASATDEPRNEKHLPKEYAAILNGPKNPRPEFHFPTTLDVALAQQIDVTKLYEDYFRDPEKNQEPLEQYHAIRLGVYAETVEILLENIGTDREAQIRTSASRLASIQARRIMYERLRTEANFEQSRTDLLTGLPNSLAFFERLREQIDSGEPYSILFVDLDKFKRVNDVHGHEAGNAVLVQAAQRLVRTVRQANVTMPGGSEVASDLRKTDFAARYGGEELVVLLSGTNTPEDLRVAGNRIVDEFNSEEFYINEDTTIPVTASVGGAIAEPNEDPIEVLRRADKHVYDAKDMGRNRYVGETTIIDVESTAVI